MRTVTDLTKLRGTVYVYLPGRALPALFLKRAAEEGFTLSDGSDPAAGEPDDLYAVRPDFTLSRVGWVGRMAFLHAKTVAGKRLIRVDYAKYAAGKKGYVMRGIPHKM